VTIVQQADGFSTPSGVPSITATFGSAATTGNAVLVVVAWRGFNPDISTLRDANTNNLYADMGIDAQGNATNVSVYLLQTITSGSGTIAVTATFNSTTLGSTWIHCYEISGVSQFNDGGCLASNYFGTATTLPTLPLTVALPNELLFCFIFPQGSPALTTNSGWTLDYSNSVSMAAYHITPPAGTYTASPVTYGAAELSLIASIAFIPAGTVPKATGANVITTKNGKLTPGGIYNLRPFTDTLGSLQTSPGWQYPGCAGHALRTQWGNLETAPGVYNWSYLDGAFALAAQYPNKKISINVEGGPVGMPSWLTGVQTLTFKAGTFPAPWDPVFQSAWQTFITAFGARYDGNPLLSYVMITGAGGTKGGTWDFASAQAADTTTFFNLYSTPTVACNTWIAAGITICGFYLNAFPTTPLCMNMGKTFVGALPIPYPFYPFYSVVQQTFKKRNIGVKNVNLEPTESPFDPAITSVPLYVKMGAPACGFQEGAVGLNGNTFITLKETFQVAASQLGIIYEAYQTDFLYLSWSPLIQQYNSVFNSFPSTIPRHAGAGFQFGPY
jgi:hypothetical protein